MAVFTKVTLKQAASFIEPLHIGNLLSLHGIPGGIENTNYFLSTDAGEFVLTLFERLSDAQLPYYLQLMQHLANRSILVPKPVADAAGRILFKINHKPAALVTKLDGHHCMKPEAHHCRQVAEMLAKMHLAGVDFPFEQPNLRGMEWREDAAAQVMPLIDVTRQHVLAEEIKLQRTIVCDGAYGMLPRGPIHADLFRDNVLFSTSREGVLAPSLDRLSGFFDFYFAGNDALLLDIAICLNDWCIHDDGRPDDLLAEAFLYAYDQIRPLSPLERRMLPALLRVAALRFWLSRLVDLHFPRESSLLQAHDPEHFFRILRYRIATMQ